MISKDSSTGWYLVYTKPNQESVAMLNLQQQAFRVYLPLLQQHKRQRNLYQIVTEPLFPRYLFIHLNSGTDDWSKIRSTRGCVSLVRFGAYPARMPGTLIDQLQHAENARLIKDPHSKPNFNLGDRVQIVGGLLADYEGIIEAKNSQERITLLLTIAEGHTKRVNLSLHEVKVVN